MSSLIQEMRVESDGLEVLTAVLSACFVWNKKATHITIAPDASSLELLWHMGSTGGVPLPFPLESGKEAAEYVNLWLSRAAVYPRERPDTDGDVAKGFRVTQSGFYCVARIEPCWIVYGK